MGVMQFDIEKLHVADTAPLILQGLNVAREWLTWHESNTDEVLRRSADSWEISRELSGKSFGFVANNPILLFAIDPDMNQRSHPLMSPMFWFAAIPWEVRRQEGSSLLRLVFSGLQYSKDIHFPRLSVRLNGYPKVLEIIDEVARQRATGQDIRIRFAVGDGQTFPFMGWTLSH